MLEVLLLLFWTRGVCCEGVRGCCCYDGEGRERKGVVLKEGEGEARGGGRD